MHSQRVQEKRDCALQPFLAFCQVILLSQTKHDRYTQLSLKVQRWTPRTWLWGSKSGHDLKHEVAELMWVAAPSTCNWRITSDCWDEADKDCFVMLSHKVIFTVLQLFLLEGLLFLWRLLNLLPYISWHQSALFVPAEATLHSPETIYLNFLAFLLFYWLWQRVSKELLFPYFPLFERWRALPFCLRCRRNENRIRQVFFFVQFLFSGEMLSLQILEAIYTRLVPTTERLKKWQVSFHCGP